MITSSHYFHIKDDLLLFAIVLVASCPLKVPCDWGGLCIIQEAFIMITGIPRLTALLALIFLAFGRINSTASSYSISPRGHLAPVRSRSWHVISNHHRQVHTYKSCHAQPAAALFFGSGDNDNQQVQVDDATREDNFDAQGFTGYLAPYALALVASIAVTAGFVKFVLLDY